jgi:hypothetical protein
VLEQVLSARDLAELQAYYRLKAEEQDADRLAAKSRAEAGERQE